MKKIREWFESLKEWWRKVLKKLAADNRKVFGKKGPGCCGGKEHWKKH